MHAVTFILFYFVDMIKVKRILIGITKLVLSRKIIFSNPDLRNDLNRKLFHTFVSTNLLLYEVKYYLFWFTNDTYYGVNPIYKTENNILR